MNIDLIKLITNNVEELLIDDEVIIPDSWFSDTSIKRLENVKFSGEVTKLWDGPYQIIGKISGVMILPDDVTMEDVSYSFVSEIEEEFDENSGNDDKKLKIVQNSLDITEFLWQNILVEIPSKVVGDRTSDLTLEGDGWRLITEEELKARNKSPFSELSKMFDSRKE